MKQPIRTWGAVVIALSLSACGGGDGENAAPLTAQESCQALAGAQIASSSIGLPTQGAMVTGVTFNPTTPSTPEYCSVQGEIASVDTTAQPIKFAVGLPTAWNNKFMHLGGGGFDGIVVAPDSTFTFPTAYIKLPSPLQRGYAVAGSDSGHAAVAGVNIGVFALNDEQLRNFAGEQLKKTHDVAVELIKRRYNQSPVKTYFMGQSEGGRESMVVVQRYGADYDGVFTLFPVFAWTGDMFKWLNVGKAMRSNGGGGWLSLAKANLLRNAQIAACDSLDGVSDGIISNVPACSFDPATLRCPGGADTGDTCLSDAQIATTAVMFSTLSFSYQLANGITSMPAYYPGTDFTSLLSLGSTSAFDLPGVISGSAAGAIGLIHNFGDSFTRYFILRNANADTFSFDPANPGTNLARVQQVSQLMDPSSTDISAFIAHGGKWILIHGLSDQLPLAPATVEYYQKLVAQYGQASLDKTMRFYTIPGFAHTGGPFAADGTIPGEDALEAWVEHGVAPGNLVVSDIQAGHVNRSRPLCVYPTWPKYNGTGDVNQAGSFTCSAS